MKTINKVMLALLGTLTLPLAGNATPLPFTGFYLGAHTGATQRSDKIEVQSHLLINGNKNHKVSGVNYGIYGGYGQQNVNGLFLGLEGNISHDTANKKKTNATVNNGKLDSAYERGIVFGLTPRIGAVINANHLVYAKLGLEMSKDEARGKYTSPSHAVTAKKSQVKAAFVPGLGYEYAFGNILGRIEYGYNLGSKIKVDDSYSVKYTAHVVKVGVAYKF